MKTILCVLILLFLFCSLSFADVIGVTQHGETVTITGEGFGVKSPAEPLIFDDFESGSVDLSWSYAYSQNLSMTVTESGVRGVSSHHVAFNMYTNQTGGFSWITDLTEQSQVYVYYWAKKKWVWGEDGDHDYGNFKFNRVGHIQDGPDPNEYGGWGYDGSLTAAQEYYDDPGAPTDADFPNTNWTDDVWWCFETYYNIKNVTEGDMIFYMNGDEKLHCANIDSGADTMTGELAHAAGVYNARFGWGGYQPSDRFQQDDVYIDNTPARVMLCENSDGTGHREIQVASEWSDTSITITFNQGSFTSGSIAYLVVFDSTGAVVASEELTVDGQSSNSLNINIKTQTIIAAQTTIY